MNIDKDKLQKRVSLGNSAKILVESEPFILAMSGVQAGLVAKIIASSEPDYKEREDAYNMIRALKELNFYLHSLIDDGKIASRTILKEDNVQQEGELNNGRKQRQPNRSS